MEKPHLFQRDLQVKQEKNASINISRIELGIVNLDLSINYSVQYIKSRTDSNNKDSLVNMMENSSIRTDIYHYLESLQNPNYFPVVAYYRGNRNIRDISDINDVFTQDFDHFDALKNALDATVSFTDLANWLFLREFQELREAKKQR